MMEYQCCDCARHVIRADIRGETPAPPRCCTCEWIAEHVDPADYPRVRELLGCRGD
jgi:hypothetical protein